MILCFALVLLEIIAVERVESAESRLWNHLRAALWSRFYWSLCRKPKCWAALRGRCPKRCLAIDSQPAALKYLQKYFHNQATAQQTQRTGTEFLLVRMQAQSANEVAWTRPFAIALGIGVGFIVLRGLCWADSSVSFVHLFTYWVIYSNCFSLTLYVFSIGNWTSY